MSINWNHTLAAVWRPHSAGLRAVRRLDPIRLDDLLGIDAQKVDLVRNTEDFLAGRPARNVLLWGSRGTGKSSLIKALLNDYAAGGLRVIEMDKADLADLPDVVDGVHELPQRFIVFCDDLSFEASETSYKALKAALDGSIAAPLDNLLIYATSNRRHLMPENMQENLETKYVGDEIHPGETVEEKISLSERFGLWVSFYPFDQDAYLDIVAHWLGDLGCTPGARDMDSMREAALQWALQRGSRSGRVAWQFARDWAGRSTPSARKKSAPRRR